MKIFRLNDAPKVLMTCLALVFSFSLYAADPALEEQEFQAIQAAQKKVEKSVVQILTVGGLETVGAGRQTMLTSSAPSTGVIVSKDGYIITSSFNFIQKPASVLVVTHDGAKFPAEIVSSDKSRNLTLLKIKATDLVVPKAQPADELTVGQSAIAIGRVYATDSNNLTVGIISAKKRIFGKAVQTDANISTVNYGGPLVDIRGQVIGIISPMSPSGKSEMAGVEWYDSGIGFAVPFERFLKQTFPKMKKEKELHSGLLGVTFTGSNLTGTTVLTTVHPNSPASEAGFKKGDKILTIGGTPVLRVAEAKIALGPFYAGDTVDFLVERDKKEINLKATLAAKLIPFEHAALGILPARGLESTGVTVRYVFADSPAEKAGIKTGDRIVAYNKKPIVTYDDLETELNGSQVGKKASLELEDKDKKSRTVEVTLASVSEEIPKTLPDARAELKSKPEENKDRLGWQKELQLPESANQYSMYVPEKFYNEIDYGLVVYFHPSGKRLTEEQLKPWKKICDENDLILLVPNSLNEKKWAEDDFEFVISTIRRVKEQYPIDSERTVAFGTQNGGSIAVHVGMKNREMFRGIATVMGPIAKRPEGTEPAHRLAYFVGLTKTEKPSPVNGLMNRVISGLRSLKYPVSSVEFTADSLKKPLDANSAKELILWIDSLDRL